MTSRTNIRPQGAARNSEFLSEHFSPRRPALITNRRNPKKLLQVMKFGGTSVGDASRIEKVIEIIRAASREMELVVVVSAMSGVTNKLIQAATQAEAGEAKLVAAIFEELRKQHDTVASALIGSTAERNRLIRKMDDLFQEGERLCQGTMLLRELTPRTRDAISSLGERLSSPLVASALTERGVASEAIEATELLVTNGCHGAADPWMDLTRQRCETRLRPLLRQGRLPVVTGFIGATAEGVLTTLGRGGSDYSATILGAAIGADELTIWTDVDGLATADPHLVPGACTIPEISYREAAELAHFGAKVLHPKTLRPVMQRGIPVWIRNTFAPQRPGTKITPAGSPNGSGVKALTAMSEVALINVGGPAFVGVPDVLDRTLATTAATRTDVLLISQSSAQNDICLVVSSLHAKRTVEALRREFAQDLAYEKVEHIALDPTLAIVTLVGQNLRGVSGIAGLAFGALGRENVNIIAIAQGSSECNFSFLVLKKDMKTALTTIHREFHLGALNSQILAPMSGERPATWFCNSDPGIDTA